MIELAVSRIAAAIVAEIAAVRVIVRAVLEIAAAGVAGVRAIESPIWIAAAVAAAAWVEAEVTALAAETFREAPVNEAAAPLAVAAPLGADLPGPVAHEVLPAWAEEAASVVVAVADEEAVAAVDEAAEAGGNQKKMWEEKQMKTKHNNSFASRIVLPACAIALTCVLGAAGYATGQTNVKAAVSPRVKQKRFATSEQAAAALIQAAEQFDVLALVEIVGQGDSDLVVTKDTVQDKQRATLFAAKAKEKTSVTPDPKNRNRAILSVGNEEWPYPVPIVKRGSGWYFDTRVGRQEILNRRIGANELDALAICRGYVEVQKEYALEARDGVNQYAQRIVSTPGKRDGLAWKNEDGSWGGPIGEDIAKALQQGYTSRTEPYHGYYFKILKGQGPAAPLGEMHFLVNGVMIGGFALVAVPAEYRVTGVKTFIVGYTGIVHEKDLGPDSLNIVKKMELYNPDRSWHPTDASW